MPGIAAGPGKRPGRRLDATGALNLPSKSAGQDEDHQVRCPNPSQVRSGQVVQTRKSPAPGRRPGTRTPGCPDLSAEGTNPK